MTCHHTTLFGTPLKPAPIQGLAVENRVFDRGTVELRGPTTNGKGVTLLVLTGGDAHEIFYPFPVSQKVREAHVPAHWTLGPPASDTTPWSQQSDAAVARGDETLGDASIEAAAPIDAVASPPSDASYMQELERLAGEAF
jgi:hypothetical protein